MKSLESLFRSRASQAIRTPDSGLPCLRQTFGNQFVFPRLFDQSDRQVIHLDRIPRKYKRAAISGPSGSGKSTCLRLIAGKNTVSSIRDYHPQALPMEFPNSGMVLLDDVPPSGSAYISSLLTVNPEARIYLGSEMQDLPVGFDNLRILPLNEREIIDASEAWFPPPALGHGGIKLENAPLEEFTAAVKANQRTRQLATNPLNLFLLLQIYSPGAQLPTHRSQLFSAYFNKRLSLETDPAFAARALEGIALSTRRGQVAKEEHLARGFGFLDERPSGRVEFVHQLLQDYATARALRQNPDADAMIEHLGEIDWRQVVLFYAGLGDPTAIIEAIIKRDDVCFAVQALAEATEIPEGLADHLVPPLVERAWQNGDQEAIDSLATLQSTRAIDFFAGKLKERDPSVRARAARILGQLRNDRAIEYLLPLLRDSNGEVRDQVVESLGKSTSDRVIEPLLVALRGDSRVGVVDTRLRCAAARALGDFGSEKAVPALLVDLQIGEPEVREAAASALIQIRGALAVKPLKAIIDSNHTSQVRDAASEVLSAIAGS